MEIFLTCSFSPLLILLVGFKFCTSNFCTTSLWVFWNGSYVFHCQTSGVQIIALAYQSSSWSYIKQGIFCLAEAHMFISQFHMKGSDSPFSLLIFLHIFIWKISHFPNISFFFHVKGDCPFQILPLEISGYPSHKRCSNHI